MSRTGKLIKNTGIYAIGDICPRLFTFLIFPIFTTHLPPSEYGIINYINTIDTFLSVISILSLNTFFLVYYYKVDGEQERKKLMGNLSIFVFAFSLFLTAILFLVGPSLFTAWGSNVDFYPYISLGVIFNLCNVVTLLPTCLYRVQERPLPLTILNVSKSFLILIASTLVVTAYPGGAYEVLVARVSIAFIFSLIFLMVTRKEAIFNINFQQLKIALRFSLPLVPGALAFYLFSLFDRILIDKYLSLTDLGIYSTASTLALLLNIISNGAYRAFEPYFFQTIGKERFKRDFERVRDILLASVLIGSIFIGLLAKEFFELFSSQQYWEAYKYVTIILIGAVASAMGLMYETVIIAKEKTITTTIITIIGSLISISLNIIFLPRFGISMAAMVFAFSFCLTLFLKMIYSKESIAHMRPIILSIIVFSFIEGITFCLRVDSLTLSIIIKLCVGIVLSLFVLYSLRIVPTEIFKMLKN